MKTRSEFMRNDRPLLVDPQVAAVIGLNEAMVLQQVMYWLKKSDVVRNGRRWIYNTYDEWHEQFPFWSVSTIGRIFRKLEEEGYLISEKFNAEQYDHTKWYSIDFDRLDHALLQSGIFDDANLTHSDDANLTRSTYNKDYTETTAENTSEEVPPAVEGPTKEQKQKTTPLLPFIQVYEQNIGIMPSLVMQRLIDYHHDPRCKEGWVADAIREAVNSGVRKPKYIYAILNRWLEEGQQSNNHREQSTADAWY